MIAVDPGPGETRSHHDHGTRLPARWLTWLTRRE
jgi:hypothetical protein